MKITLLGEYCDLNRFLKATNNNRYGGASVKKSETERVCWQCKGKKPIKEYPVVIKFDWYSQNLKKDIDNVAFAKKFILDGLVMAGVIENDSRKFITGFSDKFYIDAKNPRVEIEISKC